MTGRLKGRLLRRALLVLTVTALTMGPAVAAPAPGPAPSEGDVTPVERQRQASRGQGAGTAAEAGGLSNFEHVFQFSFPGGSAQDQGTDIEFYTPRVAQRDPATGEKVLDAAGNPVLVSRDFAIVGSYDRGAFVFDITDPENTKFVTLIDCKQQQNDVQIKQFGDRWLLALSRDGTANPCAKPVLGASGNAGIAVFDITDPYEAKPLYSFRTAGGAHNFTFHPTKPVGWVSTGDLPGGMNRIPIVDFSDPLAPRLATTIAGPGGPHDITFNAAGTRAYVASENNMRIYDTTDPLAPKEVSTTTGPGSYIHGADATPDGKTLLMTDESLVLGGFFASRTAVCPGGGFTLYNIEGSNETAPRPVGFGVANLQAPTPDHRACTAHVGEITPNSKYYVTGWYYGGVRLFDISNPSAPTDIGHAMLPSAEPWSAKFHKGQYVYTGDLGRGFDVYRWTGPQDLGLPPVGAS